MAFIHRRPIWQMRGLKETPQSEFEQWNTLNRRGLLRAIASGAAAAFVTHWTSPAIAATPAVQDKKKKEAGSESGTGHFPAEKNGTFQLDRPLTNEQDAARYNNFYEFSEGKRVAALVKHWDISGWKLEIAGLVDNPSTFDMDELAKKFPYEERLYRFRCVETWAMAVPWTGFPLKALLDHVKPHSSARFVKFVSFDHKKAKGTRAGRKGEPWPYTEGLTIAEAANDLTFVATGIYGHELPKQHGAPIRMAIPWKYGFKGAKSLVKIELVATRPASFWNTINASEYDFIANVDPRIPHPRWSQEMEWDVGTKVRRRTLPFNGYGDLVGSLYMG
jgi:methionine sulfoxide reductase catalytic subunit